MGDVLSCAGFLQTDPWEVRSMGTELWDAWDYAELLAFTRFCEEHHIHASYSTAAAFPLRDWTSDHSTCRINNLLDPTFFGHNPTLAMSTRYSLALLSMYDHIMAENEFYQDRLRLAHTREQEQALLISAQAQVIAEQAQQIGYQAQQIEGQAQHIGEQAQQIEDLNEEIGNQNALIEHLEDELP